MATVPDIHAFPWPILADKSQNQSVNNNADCRNGQALRALPSFFFIFFFKITLRLCLFSSPSFYNILTVMSVNTHSTGHDVTSGTETASMEHVDHANDRSAGAYSTRKMIDYLRTPRFIKAMLLGQFLSLCITATNTFTTKLAQEHNVNAPTAQSLINYVLLAIVYNTVQIFRRGPRRWLRVLLRRGWVCK
jgi:hypothetical protein